MDRNNLFAVGQQSASNLEPTRPHCEGSLLVGACLWARLSLPLHRFYLHSHCVSANTVLVPLCLPCCVPECLCVRTLYARLCVCGATLHKAPRARHSLGSRCVWGRFFLFWQVYSA